jgi:hypothetical protein
MPDIIIHMVEQLCSTEIHFKLKTNDLDYSAYSRLYSAEPDQRSDFPGRAAGMHDYEAGDQSVVSIVNNFAAEPSLGQFTQEPYL